MYISKTRLERKACQLRVIGYNNELRKSSLVMDLKETIISSFFFHLVLFLFMLALSSATTGFPGSFDNIISVNLTAEDNNDLPAKGTDPADEPPRSSSAPANAQASLSDQAVNYPPRESKQIPEPENKPAADTAPAKMEAPEKLPTQGEGTDRLEAYYRFIMLHRKIFDQKAGVRVNALIGEALKLNTRSFYGGTAIVTLKFGPEGELIGVAVDSGSPELKAFLEEVGWYDVPAPAAYLGHTVQIEFTVLEGYLSFKINTV
jgi:hypothetical protein